MNENERMEKEINEQIGFLDRFEHPGVSEEWMQRMAGSMVQKHRQGRTLRLVFRIATPAVAAAMVFLAFSIFQVGKNGSGVQKLPVKTETVSIWSLNEEETSEQVFADLDFSATTTQPASKTAANENSVEELNKAILEAMNLS